MLEILLWILITVAWCLIFPWFICFIDQYLEQYLDWVYDKVNRNR